MSLSPLMHRRLQIRRRRRAALVTMGLVAAASVGTLRTLSTAEAAAGSSAGAAHSLTVASVTPQGPDGKQVFATTCAACHQASGAGVEGVYPPLAGSEWVAGDEKKLARIVLHGVTGPIEVAGETYSGAMPPWGGVLKDPEIAAVLTYIRSSWGNKGAPVSTATVASVRAASSARKTPWTATELAK